MGSTFRGFWNIRTKERPLVCSDVWNVLHSSVTYCCVTVLVLWSHIYFYLVPLYFVQNWWWQYYS